MSYDRDFENTAFLKKWPELSHMSGLFSKTLMETVRKAQNGTPHWTKFKLSWPLTSWSSYCDDSVMVNKDQYIGSVSFLHYYYIKYFKIWQIWTFLTFDPLITGQMKRSPWTLFNDWHWPTHWLGQFCCWRLFKIWPLIETNLNFSDLCPLTTGWTKRSPWTLFDDWHWPTHSHSQFCCWRLIKIWLFNSDPKMTSDQKFLNT